MKKSLLALAALTAFAGAASAQSSVTLFGIVDAGVARISAGGTHVTGMTNSGYNSSRLGFRGVEDLGGGLSAQFWLEGQLFNDSGDGSSTGGSLDFRRRSTVSLVGNFGEIRLGRDYTPTFWNLTVYDPFGTNGIGQAMTIGAIAGSGSAAQTATAVRSNNSISYFLPGSLGGFQGQVMYAFGENTGGIKTNNYLGFRLGYAAGPISAHVAYSKTEGATDAADYKVLNFGASFDAGVVKPTLVIHQEKNGAGVKVQSIEPGILVPVGPGVIRASYARHDIKNSDNDWNKIALGYVHNVSKRTALYATYARVSNKGTQNRTVANNGLTSPNASPGGNASGVEFGVRHSF
ncbi:MAG: porin [Proteobacteria bacterium]|nr:porin [Pseudomonadota bacterium]